MYVEGRMHSQAMEENRSFSSHMILPSMRWRICSSPHLWQWRTMQSVTQSGMLVPLELCLMPYIHIAHTSTLYFMGMRSCLNFVVRSCLSDVSHSGYLAE